MVKDDERQWYAYYTKSRHEKNIRDLLIKRGYDVFLPLQKVLRQWTDRKKKVEVPLFRSYIFIKTHDHQIQDVLQVPGISWNIRHNDKPAILHEKEYKNIQRFLDTGLTIEISGVSDLEEGDQVKVMDGPLKGAIGQISRKEPSKFTVILDAIGQLMRVEIDPGLLKKYN